MRPWRRPLLRRRTAGLQPAEAAPPFDPSTFLTSAHVGMPASIPAELLELIFSAAPPGALPVLRDEDRVSLRKLAG